MQAIMTIFGLSSCSEPKIPVGVDEGWSPDVGQVLYVYERDVRHWELFLLTIITAGTSLPVSGI
jgi:hypothetical protein